MTAKEMSVIAGILNSHEYEMRFYKAHDLLERLRKVIDDDFFYTHQFDHWELLSDRFYLHGSDDTRSTHSSIALSIYYENFFDRWEEWQTEMETSIENAKEKKKDREYKKKVQKIDDTRRLLDTLESQLELDPCEGGPHDDGPFADR